MPPKSLQATQNKRFVDDEPLAPDAERFDFRELADTRLREPEFFGTSAARRWSRIARSKGFFTAAGSSMGTKFLREERVLAGIGDEPKETLRFRIIVAQRLVDLPALKRNLVSFVVDADHRGEVWSAHLS